MFAFANSAPWGPLQRKTPGEALVSLWFSIHRAPNTCMVHVSWPLSLPALCYSYSSLFQFLHSWNIKFPSRINIFAIQYGHFVIDLLPPFSPLKEPHTQITSYSLSSNTFSFLNTKYSTQDVTDLLYCSGLFDSWSQDSWMRPRPNLQACRCFWFPQMCCGTKIPTDVTSLFCTIPAPITKAERRAPLRGQN